MKQTQLPHFLCKHLVFRRQKALEEPNRNKMTWTNEEAFMGKNYKMQHILSACEVETVAKL